MENGRLALVTSDGIVRERIEVTQALLPHPVIWILAFL